MRKQFLAVQTQSEVSLIYWICIFSILLKLLCGNPIGRIINIVKVIILSSSLKPMGILGSKVMWLQFSMQPLAMQHLLVSTLRPLSPIKTKFQTWMRMQSIHFTLAPRGTIYCTLCILINGVLPVLICLSFHALNNRKGERQGFDTGQGEREEWAACFHLFVFLPENACICSCYPKMPPCVQVSLILLEHFTHVGIIDLHHSGPCIFYKLRVNIKKWPSFKIPLLFWCFAI